MLYSVLLGYKKNSAAWILQKCRHKLRAESRIKRWCKQVGSDRLGVKPECSPGSTRASSSCTDIRNEIVLWVITANSTSEEIPALQPLWYT